MLDDRALNETEVSSRDCREADLSIDGISGPQIWGARKNIPPPDLQNLGGGNTFPPQGLRFWGVRPPK